MLENKWGSSVEIIALAKSLSLNIKVLTISTN